MAEITAEIKKQTGFMPSFYVLITLVMAFFIFGGFALTYWGPLATGTFPPAPPVVHLHGVVFFSWMILLVTQALLVNVKNVALHRSVGTFGIGLGTAVFLVGSLITLLSLSEAATYNPNDAGLTYLSFVAIVTFGVLFVMAMRSVRNPQKHKRLILFATIVMLPPGINRLYMMTMGLTDVPFLATYLTMDALIAAIMVHDWRTMGKVSSTSIIGAAAIIIPELLLVPATESAVFAGLNDFLHGLVYYR